MLYCNNHNVCLRYLSLYDASPQPVIGKSCCITNAGWLYLKKKSEQQEERKLKTIILFLKIHIKSSSCLRDEKKTYSGVRTTRDGFLLVENNTDVDYKYVCCCSMIRWQRYFTI